MTIFAQLKRSTAARNFSLLLSLTIATSGPIASALAQTPTAKADGVAFKFAQLLGAGQYGQAFKTMDSSMQTALPQEKLALTWQDLESRFGKLKSLHNGKSTSIAMASLNIIVADFANSTLDLKITTIKGKISGFYVKPHLSSSEFPDPSYADKASFSEESIKIGSGTFQLDGTLTLPNGTGPFPAVVLVHGSGPSDRDETVGAVKVFRDLAWGLASKEIAVLRYEKRTLQHGKEILASGKANALTVKEETIDDALLAVALLSQDKRIESNHIFVLGHSLGGMLLPRIAKLDEKPAGFIALAAPARPLEDLLLEQMKAALGESQPTIINLQEKIKLVKDPALSTATDAKKLPLSLPASYWLDLRGYEPARAAKEIKKPILILQGAGDKQVTMTDFQIWWDALNSAPNATFKVYNALNHCFVNTESNQKSSNVDINVINDLCKWIKSES